MAFELFEEEKQKALQAELDKIGAVLEFQIFQIPQNFSGENVDENFHRQFLVYHFEPYDNAMADYANRLPYPKWLENYPEFADVEKAIPQILDSSAIKNVPLSKI